MRFPDFTGTEPCTEVGTDMFFTEEESGRKVNARQMRALCRGCEMLFECREYALQHHVYGFWGGTTEADRRRIRKARGIVAEPIYESA